MPISLSIFCERDVNYHFDLNFFFLVSLTLFQSRPIAVADDRHRRKSGDDAGIFGSPSRHKTIGGGAIFEAFRPRSKSDAQRAIKRPTIMTTVKNAVHVSSV